jgi:PUL domain
MPVGYTAAGQIEKMKEFIGKLAQENAAEVKVNYILDWLIKFDIKQVSTETMDQLVGLAEIAEDKSKIALIDLLRLVVLEEQQAEYIFAYHWNLIDLYVIGYVEAQDLKDKEAKVMHNYHLACLKLLTNAYQTKNGRRHMQDFPKS